jgi:benzoyl-CoA-dihydrodiol lyase
MARELDDAILSLRTNELAIGTWILKTAGDAASVLAVDAALARHGEHWFVRETIGMLRRTFARLDVTSRTLFALIEPGSCFAGTLFELALAADRSYMLAQPDDETNTAHVAMSAQNFGAYPMANGMARVAARFYGETEALDAANDSIGTALTAERALELGLVTVAPDELDWADEVRIALEERASLSPDALSGMEANLRFSEPESMETRIFGRLSAWQNWIFVRPNAVGDAGALKVFGTGNKARFDRNRV